MTKLGCITPGESCRTGPYYLGRVHQPLEYPPSLPEHCPERRGGRCSPAPTDPGILIARHQRHARVLVPTEDRDRWFYFYVRSYRASKAGNGHLQMGEPGLNPGLTEKCRGWMRSIHPRPRPRSGLTANAIERSCLPARARCRCTGLGPPRTPRRTRCTGARWPASRSTGSASSSGSSSLAGFCMSLRRC